MRITYVLTATVLLCAAGCGGRRVAVSDGRPEQVLRRMPAWYSADPQDSTRLFARSTALSADLQTAVDIATTEARAGLLLQLEARTEALTTRFREQAGVGRDAELLARFTAVSRDVTARTLQGVRTSRHEVQAEGAGYRAYVLLELPAGETSRQLLARAREDRQLRTDARARAALDELTREVARLEAVVPSSTSAPR